MPLPTLVGMLGLPGPVYLRKLATDTWPDPGDTIDDGVLAQVTENAFPSPEEGEEPVYSFFLVADDIEMRRVVLGLNSTRISASSPVSWLAFTAAEAARLSFEDTPANTPCPMANRAMWSPRCPAPIRRRASY